MMRRLLEDDRGALLLPGLFMTLVLLSVSYVVVGIARTLLAQEGMQDAADAAAFSAAVFHARGMNLLALLNLLMALLVAILVALRLVQAFFTIGSVVLYGLAWYGGATIPLAQLCQQGANQVGNVYRNAKDPVLNVVEALHTVQEATAVLVPFGAIGSGFVEAAKDHEPALGAVALPTAISLPVESDEFSVLCGRSTEIAVGGALEGFTAGLGLQGKFREIVVSPVRQGADAMGKALSGYLCGGGQNGKGANGPPSHGVKTELTLPRPAGLKSCEMDDETPSASCLRAQEELERSQPTGRGFDGTPDGSCAQDCGYDGAYESAARKARKDCNPEAMKNRPLDYTWQLSEVSHTYRFSGSRWVEYERIVEPLELKTTERPPCGRHGLLDDEEWNSDSGTRDLEHPLPLCTDEKPRFPARPRPNQLFEAHYEEATRLFSCRFEVTKSVPLASEGDGFGEDGSEDRAPHKMEDVELGDEAFQIRALAFGSGGGPTKTMRQGVKIALAGRKAPPVAEGLMSFSKILSHFSYAQAEYYFDHDGESPREDWLWEMRWRARLVRFRIRDRQERDEEEERRKDNASRSADWVAEFGGNSAPIGLETACERVGLSCPSMESLSELNTWSLH